MPARSAARERASVSQHPKRRRSSSRHGSLAGGEAEPRRARGPASLFRTPGREGAEGGQHERQKPRSAPRAPWQDCNNGSDPGIGVPTPPPRPTPARYCAG
ncbi:hypothetical protein HPB47_025344 [Ixodes persulcatus]|uniref:Uncharacterized protein n=1 Tax=Ixodes persulcatus TaxID=34615 RepID=A0AC60Q470_IXOPE|nr:hypothetical protein HPB47_025344 [Ixodes persulcatus]